MLLDFILQVLEKDWDQLSPEEIKLIKDYIRYSARFEKTITELERGLHNTPSKLNDALQEELGCQIHTSPLTQYNGALGAALFEYQIAKKKKK